MPALAEDRLKPTPVETPHPKRVLPTRDRELLKARVKAKEFLERMQEPVQVKVRVGPAQVRDRERVEIPSQEAMLLTRDPEVIQVKGETMPATELLHLMQAEL